MKFSLIKNIFTLVGVAIPSEIAEQQDNDFEVVCNKVTTSLTTRIQIDYARKLQAEFSDNYGSAAYIQEYIDDMEKHKQLVVRMLEVKDQLLKR